MVFINALFLCKSFELKTILSEQQISLTVKRLAHQILEDYLQLKDTVIIGIQPRGVHLSDRIVHELSQMIPPASIQYGKLDIRKELHVPNKTDIPFGIENKNVVIIDDVLYKGRTIRAALDALLDFGRPAKVGLCVLIDRRFSREFPIQPDYVGRAIDTFSSQKVKVNWKEKDGRESVELI